MEQIPFWKANRTSTSQEIPRILWKPKTYCPTIARHLFLFWARYIDVAPFHTTLRSTVIFHSESIQISDRELYILQNAWRFILSASWEFIQGSLETTVFHSWLIDDHKTSIHFISWSTLTSLFLLPKPPRSFSYQCLPSPLSPVGIGALTSRPFAAKLTREIIRSRLEWSGFRSLGC